MLIRRLLIWLGIAASAFAVLLLVTGNAIAALVLVALPAAFILFVHRRYGDGNPPPGTGLRGRTGNWFTALGLLFEEWRERWTGWRERQQQGAPVPAAATATAAPASAGPARPLPPPPDTLPPPETGAPAGAPSAGGAQSDLLYAIDALATELSRGDILAVRRVTATFAQAATGIGGALGRCGTRLSEPDKDYGPEIFEPFQRVSAMFRAGGMILAEADAAELSLIGATVGELAAAPRRAPHSSQLNGGNQ